jgi:hypothetical protein
MQTSAKSCRLPGSKPGGRRPSSNVETVGASALTGKAAFMGKLFLAMTSECIPRARHIKQHFPVFGIAGRELSTMAYGESQAQCLLADSARGPLHRF